MVASAFTALHAAHSMTTAAEQQQEPTLDSVYSACITFFSDWLQEECVKFPVSQFLASVGRTASASQSAALYSAKLATVESRDQMAANILAAAGLELNHCNKHVNATDRLAVIASLALAGHSSIAPSATEHESEQLLDKLLATLKTNQFLSAMLDDDSMVSAQAATWTACSKEHAVTAEYLLCAGGLWLSHCSVTTLSLIVNPGLSAATAVLLAQSALMPAQMPQSLSNPSSSKHGHWLSLWHWLPARSRLSQVKKHQNLSPDRSRPAHQHNLYLECSQRKDQDSSCQAGWSAVWDYDASR